MPREEYMGRVRSSMISKDLTEKEVEDRKL